MLSIWASLKFCHLIKSLTNLSFQLTPPPPNPAGIILTRPDYYTIPSLEDLGDLVDENGNCFVEDFTIGREGYGSIFFPGITNVANMNFDEIGRCQYTHLFQITLATCLLVSSIFSFPQNVV